MKRMIFSCFLVFFLMLLFTFSSSAEEIVESGECGDNLSYTLTQDGILTISGQGDMEDYDRPDIYQDPYFGDNSKKPVTKIVLEQGVTGIGSYAFANTAVEEVVLPSSLCRIGEGAFLRCGSLREIVIPSGVTVLSARIFAECGSLVSVSLPQGLREIGESAFYECSSLPEITLPDSLLSIEARAFHYCEKLTRINLPAEITEIPKFAFCGCYKLAAVTFPEDLTSIGAYAFASCNSLTSLTLPSAVTELGSYAFSSCIRLKSVSLPEGLQIINDHAFDGCKALSSIIIPQGVKTIGNDLFRGCTDLASAVLGTQLKKVGGNMFIGCSSLVDVTLPDGLTEIGGGAFFDCTSLVHLTIPQSITKIGGYAFYNCTALEKITLPDRLQEVTPHLFEYCKKLTTLTIPKNVTSIADTAFLHCSSLETVYYLGSREDWNRVAKGNYVSNSYRVMVYDAREAAFQCLYHGALGPVLTENYRAPTCTEYGGYDDVQRCTICGCVVKSTYKALSSLGHIWGPVQKLNGMYHRYVCARDPAHVREEAHKWDFEKITGVQPSASGCILSYACTLCGEETSRTQAHQWDLGKITAVPTPKANGTVTFTCTQCGGTKSHIIPYVPKQAASLGATEQIDVLLAYMAFIQQEKPQAYLYFDLDNDGVYEIVSKGGASAYTVYAYGNGLLRPIGELPADARFYSLKGSDLLFVLNDAGEVCTVRYEKGSLKTETLVSGAHWAETEECKTDLTKTYVSDRITLPGLTNLQKTYVKTVKDTFNAAKLKEYTGYLFFDMDRDGYYEVIEAQVIASPTGTETVFSMQYTFWTYRDGNLMKVGSFRTGSFQAEYGRPEFQRPDDGKGVILLTWIDTQKYRTDLIYFENGKLKQKQLSSDSDSDAYFYVSENTVPAYPMHLLTFPSDADLIPEASHQWDSGIIVRPAGCTNAGQKLFTCLTCGETKTESIGAKGHSYGKWKKLNETQHRRVCANDPTHIQTADHTWNGGTVEKLPTATAPGSKIYTCTLCGATKKLAFRNRSGDVNGDGTVGTNDARLALRVAVGLEAYAASSPEFLAADADHNGKITTADARLILRCAVGLQDLN